jgi:hypothetical protein
MPITNPLENLTAALQDIAQLQHELDPDNNGCNCCMPTVGLIKTLNVVAGYIALAIIGVTQPRSCATSTHTNPAKTE